MKAFTAKLVELIESKAENIAKQWADDVMKHNRTPVFSPIIIMQPLKRKGFSPTSSTFRSF